MDLSEAERPLSEYRSLNELFVRRLAPGARTWPRERTVLASPVDGIMGATGTLEDGTLVQAKGLRYTASDLLGGEVDAEPFRNGRFVTIYLSPRHYHRIHTPIPGQVVRARHIPGSLLPVNGPAVASVEHLFARNERLVVLLETELGRVAVVAVGAYNVGRISAAFDPAWSGSHGSSITNRGTPPPPEREYRGGIPVDIGDELMAFHLGSTVILLTEPGVRPMRELAPGSDVELGTVLAGPGSSTP
jgi:phosphatidylserine decarboxylase